VAANTVAVEIMDNAVTTAMIRAIALFPAYGISLHF